MKTGGAEVWAEGWAGGGECMVEGVVEESRGTRICFAEHGVISIHSFQQANRAGRGRPV